MNGHSSQNGNGHSVQNGNGHSSQNGTSGRHSNSVHGHEADMNAQEKELLNLTLQLRDKKKQDEKYAKFHGDKLIGVSEPNHLASSDIDAHRTQLFPSLACGMI
jgi:hypothetical protein